MVWVTADGRRREERGTVALAGRREPLLSDQLLRTMRRHSSPRAGPGRQSSAGKSHLKRHLPAGSPGRRGASPGCLWGASWCAEGFRAGGGGQAG